MQIFTTNGIDIEQGFFCTLVCGYRHYIPNIPTDNRIGFCRIFMNDPIGSIVRHSRIIHREITQILITPEQKYIVGYASRVIDISRYPVLLVGIFAPEQPPTEIR